LSVWYNEIDPFAAAWLRSLIDAGHLPAGVIDQRSIVEIDIDELRSFRQCHFFAGIGGWPYALRLAGHGDLGCWTGSCPCQPLSSAGQHKGHADERHLWPAFYRLIAKCRPAIVFGEQVASKDGREWLAGVRADLEALGYAVGAADLCAAGVGAPHIRQRLFWMADADQGRKSVVAGSRDGFCAGKTGNTSSGFGRSSATSGLADAEHAERRQIGVDRGDVVNGHDEGGEETYGQPGACGEVRGLADADQEPSRQRGEIGAGRDHLDAWSAAEWLPCLDGKARRVEPGVFPLADGVSARVGRLRGYGNAVVPQLAATFIQEALDAIGGVYV
jgi:DNA (cytosine-5)-methyltransferase 1